MKFAISSCLALHPRSKYSPQHRILGLIQAIRHTEKNGRQIAVFFTGILVLLPYVRDRKIDIF